MRSLVVKVRVVEDVSASEEQITAVYIRVTKEESVATDLSIPNQRARSLEICSERGWSPVALYVEPKHVGGDLGPVKRPALAHMLRDVEAGRVARVLVRHTDRLWRGSGVQDVILEALRRSGTELWDFGGLREQRSAGGRFALKVLGAAAELEKNLTGERIREMKRGKAKAGKVGGGPPPFGYTSQSRVKREARLLGMGDEDAERKAVQQCPMSRCLYADEHEAEIVKLVFDLYLRKRWGSRRIADELNRRGERRRGGGLWVATKVGRIVNDPVVAGFMSYDEDAYAKGLASRRPRFRQTLYQGAHPAIIAANTWHEAQRLKTEVNLPKLRTRSASSARTYPLTGVLSCGACGAHMRGRSSGSESFGTYVCSRRAYLGKEHGCAGASMHQGWAETTVWSYLDGLFQAPELVTRIVEEATRKRAGGQPEVKARLEAARAEASTLASKQRKWMERFEEAGDAASDLLWERINELEARRAALGEETKLLEAQLASSSQRPLSAEEISRALAKLQGFAAAPPEKRRVLVERLVHRHDLRVRVLDGRRLAVSLRLDPVGEGEGRGQVGSRLVLVSPNTQRSDEGGQDRKTRPVCPESPVPGGPASRTL
jgi:site-specific DNA recombinase